MQTIEGTEDDYSRRDPKEYLFAKDVQDRKLVRFPVER
jgi:hypothetical protein